MINSEIRAEARRALQGNWGNLAVMYLILACITGIVSGLTNFIFAPLSILVSAPFELGLVLVMFRILNREQYRIEDIFEGFRDFSRAAVAGLLIMLYVFLWMLLLIIPGIIAAMAYSQTFFILADNKNISASDAMRMSKEMMEGHKWELFFLLLSFIGWAILCAFTFGIGYLFLAPYVSMSRAVYYRTLSAATSLRRPGDREEVIYR